MTSAAADNAAADNAVADAIVASALDSQEDTWAIMKELYVDAVVAVIQARDDDVDLEHPQITELLRARREVPFTLGRAYCALQPAMRQFLYARHTDELAAFLREKMRPALVLAFDCNKNDFITLLTRYIRKFHFLNLHLQLLLEHLDEDYVKPNRLTPLATVGENLFGNMYSELAAMTTAQRKAAPPP